jgi:hypothetical protein
MSNSETIRIFKAELKENLILRQIYYQNTSSNIDNEINSIILKLNLNKLLITLEKFILTNCNTSHSL